jgi:hypothetical protein
MLEFEAFMLDFAALYSLKCRSLPITLSAGPIRRRAYLSLRKTELRYTAAQMKHLHWGVLYNGKMSAR